MNPNAYKTHPYLASRRVKIIRIRIRIRNM